MSQAGRKIVILISSAMFLLNTACTTIKVIDDSEETTYAEQIEVGDKIRLIYLDGRVKNIRVTGVSETEISGTPHDSRFKQAIGPGIVAKWQDVYQAERVNTSVLKTAGAALGLVIAIPVLVVGAVLLCGSGAAC